MWRWNVKMGSFITNQGEAEGGTVENCDGLSQAFIYIMISLGSDTRLHVDH